MPYNLPIPIDNIIPQKKPMQVIDLIEEMDENRAVICADIKKDMMFLREGGLLDEAVYIEMAAQSIAAFNSLRNEKSDINDWLLAGINNFEIKGKAGIGDRLKITVQKDLEIGGFAVFNAVVEKDNAIIAKGQIKVWHG